MSPELLIYTSSLRGTRDGALLSRSLLECAVSFRRGHSHLPAIMNENEDDATIISLRGLLIVLGLSVHELFEGLAIGLESSSRFVW